MFSLIISASCLPGRLLNVYDRVLQVMKGYHNNEEATAETVTKDGWLQTGDIAHYDESGQFHITDRLKELIKVNL